MTSEQETQDRNVIAKALWGYGQDTNQAAYIDNILNSTIGTMPIEKFKQQGLRNLIALRHYGQAIRSQEFDTAIKWAKSISDKEFQAYTMHKVAGYASANPATLDMARDALLSIENSLLQPSASALGQLSMAQVVRGNLDQAKELANQIKDSTLRDHCILVIDFAIQHYREPIEQVKPIAFNSADSGVYLERMALINAIHKNVAGMGEFLGYNKYFTGKEEERQRANIIGFYATVLGFSGLYDEALSLLNEIHDPKLRLIQLAGHTIFFPFSETTIQSAFLQIARTPFAIILENPIFEMAFSDQMDKAIKLLHKIENLKVRNLLFDMLVEYIYQLLEISRGHEPVPVSKAQGNNLSARTIVAGILFLLFGIASIGLSLLSLGSPGSISNTSIWEWLFLGASGLFMISSGIVWFLRKKWASLIGGIGCCLFSIFGFISISYSGVPGLCGTVAIIFLMTGVFLIIRYFIGRKKQNVS